LRAAARDNGKEFKTKAMPGRTRGLGLTTMREQAAIIDGELAVRYAKDVGPTVEITVPRK